VKPIQFSNTLAGLTWAFMELHELVIDIGDTWLSRASPLALQGMTYRETQHLLTYLEGLRDDKRRLSDFWTGLHSGGDLINSVIQLS
jgi:hypothetical protein